MTLALAYLYTTRDEKWFRLHLPPMLEKAKKILSRIAAYFQEVRK
jgi:hypothetical protein